jgi:hypothetical protein
MTMLVDHRSRPWLVEGETVQWGEIRAGVEGWTCTCWANGGKARGEPPSCFHVLAVSDAAFLKIDVEESGPKVVSLSAKSRSA